MRWRLRSGGDGGEVECGGGGEVECCGDGGEIVIVGEVGIWVEPDGMVDWMLSLLGVWLMRVMRWGYRILLLIGSWGGQTNRKCSIVSWDRRSHILQSLLGSNFCRDLPSPTTNGNIGEDNRSCAHTFLVLCLFEYR